MNCVFTRLISGPRLMFTIWRRDQRGKIGARSIYDKVERMSNSSLHSGSKARRLPWRAACLVLALFLLYNPFFTICPTAGPAATLQHHLSYRSTIAASELGCSNLQHSEVSVEPIVSLIATLFDSVRPAEDIARPRPNEETVATSDGFASPSWSRPPPTL